MKEVTFVPYWRFKGTVFSCKGYKIDQRIIDTSFIASPLQLLPRSLGLRPQALKLKFVSPEMEGQFIKRQIPFKSVISFVEKQMYATTTSGDKNPIHHQAFIGETLSIIYTPILIRDKVYDGILNRPIGTFPKNEDNNSLSIDHHQNWQTTFIPTLCPYCGWDLDGEKDSLVLFCKNCASAWKSSKIGFQKVDFAIIANNDDNVNYLPFWRMRSQIEGLQIQSYADLVRVANLPKAIRKEWEDREFFFWAPAFKVKPTLFIRLARQMTIFQPQTQFEKSPPRSTFHPVTLPRSEAMQSIKVTLASLANAKQRIFPLLSEIDIILSEILLVYFPFILKGSEFIQPSLQFSINKNSLYFGRNL
ncbi:MAG: hypothetical protein SWO11_05985 [Thermodesulfobacteriota bacterium]|nr:hypothetical protein [Thermodesulfobacteriota bacterium]